MADPTYRKQAVTRRWEDRGKCPIQVKATRGKDRAGEAGLARDPVQGAWDPVLVAWDHPVEWGHRVVEAASNQVVMVSLHFSAHT